MGTIFKIFILGVLVWGYFACVQGLSNKAFVQLDGMKQFYNVDNIQASLADR